MTEKTSGAAQETMTRAEKRVLAALDVLMIEGAALVALALVELLVRIFHR